MKIRFDRKTVSLSIGEFSGFTTTPVSGAGEGRGSGLWRARAGTAWHDALRGRVETETPDARFEVPIQGRWPHRDWILELQGRADQVLPTENGLLIREVKTVTTPLPASESELRNTYPAYFLQLAAYRALYPLGVADRAASDRPGAELLFLELATGLTQQVSLEPADHAAFEEQVSQLVAFLQFRETRLKRLRDLHVLPPFSEPRPGQEEVDVRLADAVRQYPILLFQAPTGFGKTGYLLEMALNALKEGRVTRIVYLTGKSTGQLQVLRQLRAMLPENAPVSYIQVRNKKAHCIHSIFHCFRESCPYLDDLESRWRNSGEGGAGLLHPNRREIDLDALRDSGKRAGICPYEITRTTLAGTDVWVGDYNYVFSPWNRSFFYERPGFDPSQTLLIVDEAHNLPTRAADNYAVSLGTEETRNVLTDFTFRDVSPGLRQAWQNLLDVLADLRPCNACAPADEASLAGAARAIAEQLVVAPPDYASLGPDILGSLDKAVALHQFLENTGIEKLLWVPEGGILRATCLDASAPLGETLRSFRSVVLASATFGPGGPFLGQCGLEPHVASVARIDADAPWRAGAYDLAIDLRVDTRFRKRAQYLSPMADTIARIAGHASGPVAVFFPSYRYARDLMETLGNRSPEVRVALQERRTLSEQTDFIEESLLLADVLFLILGSRFSEGIDLLGGRIEYALVAGPALPEVNAVQQARMESRHAGDHETGRDARFRVVYQIPGMQKINQALGRLVRAPGHRARVLLQCRRFAEPSYLNLLDRDLQPNAFIGEDADFDAWLSKP